MMDEKAVQLKVQAIVNSAISDGSKVEMMMDLIREQVMYEGRRSFVRGYSDATKTLQL